MNPIRLPAALAVLLILAGCGSSGTSPVTAPAGAAPVQDAAAGGFGFFDPGPSLKGPGVQGIYPLALGNYWVYERTFRVVAIDAEGNTLTSTSHASTVEHRQICFVTIDGREYLTEFVLETGDGGVSATWIRFRQDRAGLFEADQTGPEPHCPIVVDASSAPPPDPVALGAEAIARISDPLLRATFERAWEGMVDRVAALRALSPADPARLLPRLGSPGLPPEGELQRLRYPLMPAQRWIIRDAPRFEAVADRYERLDLPAGPFSGWRIRYENEFMGAADRVHVWYGPEGFLRLVAHLESLVVDPHGALAGRVFVDEVQELEGLALVDAGATGAAAIR